jgi:hypothetical protein
MYASYMNYYTVLDLYLTDIIMSVPKYTVRKAVVGKLSKQMFGVVELKQG